MRAAEMDARTRTAGQTRDRVERAIQKARRHPYGYEPEVKCPVCGELMVPSGWKHKATEEESGDR